MQDKLAGGARETKRIAVEVGLHQDSAISPLVSVIIIDVITEAIEEGTPWAMLFAQAGVVRSVEIMEL